MNSLLFVFLTLMSGKSVEAHFTENPPQIDGVIEEVWQYADSAYNFIQHWPYEKEDPTDRTIVYLLQDEENLYVAFRCYAEVQKPTACLTADEDHVQIGVDPFGSKTTGYYFLVYGSGIRDEGWILNDGRWRDNSWDGVWYRAVKVYDDHYVVEMKIPFKTLRYKKGLNTWGIQFSRYHAANRETDYWTEVLQSDDDLISRWSSLEGINPRSTGYYFELYPEGYMRRDQYVGEKTDYKPSGSINMKWDITPQASLSATAFPDFAQIESDPFVRNLGRYPTYLDERRPFFLEGKDIFNTAHGGIFYSRRIGKSVNGDAVPILGGMKFTSKTEQWSIGGLGAFTDEYTQGDSVIEPYREFGVARIKRRILKNSEIGVIMGSSVASRDDYNYAVGMDGVYRKGVNSVDFQGAVSDRDGKKGWSLGSCTNFRLPSFRGGASFEFVDDSFDVGDIGYLPWAGRKELGVWLGPYRSFPTGMLSYVYAGPEIFLIQEPGNPNWSTAVSFGFNIEFRNGWGNFLDVTVGNAFEADTNYFYRSLELTSWGKFLGQFFNLWNRVEYGYNYARGFPAYSSAHSVNYSYSFIDQLSAGLNANLWVEWDTTNTVLAMYPRLRPLILIRFNADANLSLFSELVLVTPGTEYGKTELYSNRIGALFSWNFRPKSWIYLALNDYSAQDEYGEIHHQYQISAAKLKYLLYF
jgi:hypothetical protein